jgi:hypothetical protein
MVLQAAEKSRGVAGVLSTATSPTADDLPQLRRASVVALCRFPGGVTGEVRENGEGANGRKGEGSRGAFRLITEGVHSV